MIHPMRTMKCQGNPSNSSVWNKLVGKLCKTLSDYGILCILSGYNRGLISICMHSGTKTNQISEFTFWQESKEWPSVLDTWPGYWVAEAWRRPSQASEKTLCCFGKRKRERGTGVFPAALLKGEMRGKDGKIYSLHNKFHRKDYSITL